MIIDEIPLSGEAAYLRAPDGHINLGGSSPATGRYAVSADGLIVRVDGIDLHLVSPDLIQLFARQGTALFKVHVEKEMFPGLFADPYRHRVHAIAGFDDFKRGECVGLVAMEVDGTPTLVSLGTDAASWVSPVYPLAGQTAIEHAAWDFAGARTGYEEAFRYDLGLEIWRTSPITGPRDDEIRLAEGATPTQPRRATDLGITGVRAYRLVFTAKVDHDAAIHELHLSATTRPTLGRPLLRAVNLLEPVDSPHDIYSLHEMQIAGGDLSFIDAGREAPQALTATLGVTATLVANESIAIEVLSEKLERLEARLSAVLVERPPVTHREP
jgi:hypothetical protein